MMPIGFGAIGQRHAPLSLGLSAEVVMARAFGPGQARFAARPGPFAHIGIYLVGRGAGIPCNGAAAAQAIFSNLALNDSVTARPFAGAIQARKLANARIGRGRIRTRTVCGACVMAAAPDDGKGRRAC